MPKHLIKSIGYTMFGKQKNILENFDHVNIVDKWARIQGFTCNESDCLYLAEKIKEYFGKVYRDQDLLDRSIQVNLDLYIPCQKIKEYFGKVYRDQDLLELSDQVKQILVCANSII